MGVKGGGVAGIGVASDVTAIKNLTDTLPVGITEATGVFSYDETSAAEQAAVTLTITARSVIGGIWLDLVNVTQDTTIRVCHKIDGTNYRCFQVNPWITTDQDGVLLEGFTAYRDIRVTLQCGGGGVGSVSVPYAVV
jgi:hypothetical protein